MKPKPNHFIRLTVYFKDTEVASFQARTAKELSEKANISMARIYNCYRKKRGDLKMAFLTYKVEEVCPENSSPQRKCVI